MIRITTLAGKAVAVFGLARTGITAARALLDGGARVSAWDDTPAQRDAATAAGIPVVDLGAADWSGFDALVTSPGVPLTHPKPHWTVERANAAGVAIIGDVELFFRERKANAPGSPVIAITGTNGKSTTTALTAHLLKGLGLEVAMGGNIGVGVLSLAPPDGTRVHVLELSSFQIDLTPTLEPTVGVLLNITPDHLDRHGTLEQYAGVKARLVAGAEIACIGADDDPTRRVIMGLAESGRPPKVFSAGRGSGLVPDAYAIGDTLFLHLRDGTYATSTEIARLAGIPTLRGMHNVQNALASLVAIRALAERLGRLDELWILDRLRAGLATYPGLPHRMEEVGFIGRTLIINDSKATNADSTEKALASFPGDIHWILGGKAKDGGIESLMPHFSRIARAYLVGEATEMFARTLEGRVPHERCGSIDVALTRAIDEAAASPAARPIVLLSPACASYDQFKSFEHRGDAFRDLARAFGATPRGGVA